MLKLNNKGWSMNEMLFYWAILAFFLLIAIFYIYKFYEILGIEPKRQNQYELMELKMESAANKYVLQNTFDSDVTSITITLDELESLDYIDNINDVKDNSACDGYVKVSINGKITSKAYIKCSNYETKGYIE